MKRKAKRRRGRIIRRKRGDPRRGFPPIDRVGVVEKAIEGLKSANRSIWDALFSTSIQSDRFSDQTKSLHKVLDKLDELAARVEMLETRKR